jgi:hypothetical protein
MEKAMTLTNVKPNGDLPASREAAVQQGLAYYQETAAERDRLHDEVSSLKTSNAGYKVAIDVLEAQLAEARSLTNTAYLIRDQAIADRVKWESLFVSLLAQLKAFAVPAAPLVRSIDDAENAAPSEAAPGGQ